MRNPIIKIRPKNPKQARYSYGSTENISQVYEQPVAEKRGAMEENGLLRLQDLISLKYIMHIKSSELEEPSRPTFI